MQVAEAARRKADEELKRVRAETSTAAEQAAVHVAASMATAKAAEAALTAKSTEVGFSDLSHMLVLLTPPSAEPGIRLDQVPFHILNGHAY